MTAEKRSIDKKLEALEAMREQSHTGGVQQRIDQQHNRGKLTARERLALLMDEGTFEEMDSFVTHRTTDFGLADRKAQSQPLHSARPFGARIISGCACG